MNRQIEYLCLIPARGGSQRLPGKNIKSLQGKPMIGWTIEAARAALPEAEIVVSTDCEQIKNSALTCGAKIPFMRPQHLSTSTASSMDVILHCIDHYLASGVEVKNLILLQPTSPLRTASNIEEALFTYNRSGVVSVISVCEAEHSPIWQNELGKNDSMADFIKPEFQNKRSQDLPTYYRLNGAIYIAPTGQLQQHKTFFLGQGTTAYKMDAEASVDVDNALDFKLADLIMSEKIKNHV